MGVQIGGLVAVVVFYLLILAIGIWAARKTGLRIRNIDSNEMMLAGRKIGMLLGCFTMTATWVGGGVLNGSAEIVARSGLVWCQAPIHYGLSTVSGGLFFAKKMRAREYNTMLDPFERKYGRLMSMLIFLVTLCGEIFYSAAVLSALGGTLAVILDLDPTISIIISASISLLYTLAGGLYSVAYTDVVQLILMLIGLWLSLPFALTNNAVPDIRTNSGDLWIGELTPSDIGVYVDLGLLMTFGGIPWQVYFQRVLSARSPSVAMGLSYVAGFTSMAIPIPAVLIGAVGAVADWNQTDYKGDIQENLPLMLPLVLRYLCPTWVGIIGLGAISAAVMSSTDSSLLSCSSMFANNVFSPCYTILTSRKLSGTATVWTMRCMQVFHAVLACVLAIKFRSVYVLLHLSSDLVYVAIFPQLCCVIYMKSSNTYGSIVGFVTGLMLRALGGDEDLGIRPVIRYPWYSEERGQLFPHKTLAMLISFFTIICVSYLAKFLFEHEYLPKRLDFFHCFYPSSSTIKSESCTGQDNELFDMKDESNDIHTVHDENPSNDNVLSKVDPEQSTEEPIPKYQPDPKNELLNPRKVYVTKIEVTKM